MDVKEIAKQITESAPTKPVLIAIDGFGGSGKSTKASELCDLLGNTYVIGMDDFIVKNKILEPLWDAGSYDYSRLQEQVLGPIANNHYVQYQRLLWETNSLSDFIRVPTVEYLIIEGISCMHPSIIKYYTYKIWVDTPIDVAKLRGQLRDKGNENEDKWDLWASNDLAYQEKYHSEQKADFIISNK